MLSRFKMSQKIVGGFLLVILLLGSAVLFEFLTINKLAKLQKESNKRAMDVATLGHVMEDLDMSYGIIADAIINRKLDDTKANMDLLRDQAAKGTEILLALADTDEEKAWSYEYSSNFNAYLAIFKNEVLPLLAAKSGDAVLDQETLASIQEMDGRIDQKREAADTPLSKFIESVEKEAAEANNLFKQEYAKFVTIPAIIAVFSAVAGMLIAFFLSRGITRPINATVETLSNGSDHIAAAASQVASASQTLAGGASAQASALEETSASIEELASMTRQTADNSNQADTLMNQSLSTINNTNAAMAEMDQSMSQIATASEQTFKIIKTIDEIAFQTNLLALNAAVEAARAGEAGAGFAVVADEVRNLAMRATAAAKDTAELIEDTVQKVGTGKEIVTKVTGAFKEVAESSSKVGSLLGEITAASKEQAHGIALINQAITQMSSVTQQNSASSEESAAAAEELNSQAESMIDTVMVLRALIEGRIDGSTYQKKPAPKKPTAPSPSPAVAPAHVAPKSTPKPKLALSMTTPASPRKPQSAIDPESVIPMNDNDTFEDF